VPAWSALGFEFSLGSDSAESTDQLGLLLSSLPSAAGAAPAPLALTGSLAELMTEINLGAIEAADGNLLFHAGAVCDADGRTVVICGPSGSGKTTLTTELVAAGLAYLTDETVCVDPQTLRVTPFRKPLSLKPGSQPLFPHLRPAGSGTVTEPADPESAWLVAPSALAGPDVPSVPLTPELLIFPTHRGDAELLVEPVPAAQAAHLLGTHSSHLRNVRGGPLPALARLTRRAPAYRVVHSGAGAASRAVLDLLAQQ